MTYECVCDVYEGEQAEFQSTRLVVGRKEHKCCECQDAIKVGEKHQVIAYKHDGQFGSDRTCLWCVEERARLAGKYSDMPPVIGELACWLMDELRSDGDSHT